MAAEAFGAEVLKLIKLLTPQEVDKITRSAMDEGIKEAQGANVEQDVITQGAVANLGHRNLVLDNPHQVDEEEEEDEEEEVDPYKDRPIEATEEEISEVESLLDDGDILNLTGLERIRQEQEQKEKIEKSQKQSQTEFIMEEQLKSQHSNWRLRCHEVIKTYQATDAMDITGLKQGEDLSRSSHKGILLNKKQY